MDDVDRFNMFCNKSCMNPSFNYKVWPEYVLLQLRRMNVIQWIKKINFEIAFNSMCSDIQNGKGSVYSQKFYHLTGL